jgi:hypothetical protein
MNGSLLTYGFGMFALRGYPVIYGFGLVHTPVVQLNFSLSIQQESLFSLER